ncbi:MAG: hypothetical protein KTR28_07145 [Micavibrio sp.]|nr:hypothetical protein [Micavibrio sp.]
MSLILNWIDFLWLPILLLLVEKKQRLLVAGMFLSCALMMRMQVELIEWTGHTHGLIGLMDSPVQLRAIASYNIFYMLYAFFAIWSKAHGVIFLAASISLFFAAMVVSMGVMML